MSDRLNPGPLLLGQWRSLGDISTADAAAGDVIARIAVYGVPVTVGILVYAFDGKLQQPGAVLAGVALLAGAFLSAFTHVAGLRLRLTERSDRFADSERPDRDYLDESATHLLVAALTAGVTAVVLVIGMNFTERASDGTLVEGGALVGWWAATVAVLATFVGVLFAISIPRLYIAYVRAHHLRERISGYR